MLSIPGVAKNYFYNLVKTCIFLAILKKVFMDNLTPMTSCFTAEVTNFEALDVKLTSVEDLLNETGLQKVGKELDKKYLIFYYN